MERVLRYARIPDVDDYLKMGWIYRPGLEGSHHSHYSVFVEWLCNCPIPMKKVSREGERVSGESRSSRL